MRALERSFWSISACELHLPGGLLAPSSRRCAKRRGRSQRRSRACADTDRPRAAVPGALDANRANTHMWARATAERATNVTTKVAMKVAMMHRLKWRTRRMLMTR